MTTQENGNREKKRKINALMIVGVVLMFAGGPLVAPAKYIVEVIGAVLAIIGFIKVRKAK